MYSSWSRNKILSSDSICDENRNGIIICYIDLRAAAQTPPARHEVNTSIREAEQTSQSSTPHSEFKLSGKINCKKSSLATMGISRRQYSTQFDEIIEVLIYLDCITYFKNFIKTN